MPILRLPVRYYPDSTPDDVQCREEDFELRGLEFELYVEQTALVLVDLRNVQHIESWVERAEAVTRERIAPLVERARQLSMTIVHAATSSTVLFHRIGLPRPIPAVCRPVRDDRRRDLSVVVPFRTASGRIVSLAAKGPQASGRQLPAES